MSRHAWALAVVCSVLFCGAVFAGEQDFTLVNDTGTDIHQLFISQSSADDWQEDVLGTGLLKDGDSADITFSGDDSTAFWDIKVVDGEGTEIVWVKLNLKKISKVTLQFDDEGNPVASVE